MTGIRRPVVGVVFAFPAVTVAWAMVCAARERICV